ncbi:hypothetical protein SDRG_15788 [Saprolegnia diclina VS20]|uniref:PH domain-containing protein n=1 Tax=Saprolegnia diclina (strain VS20) TaxID=1156394 RepID=T0RA28_SAPDV|nr:hypothetical protein SDRG_15788 [Saprolegnia diclina VS20]EQC26377.1 hypothetical protein SDRG_15788 [Saprolegnia diclina VS20]|eukprot:XP_008620192.1 hypothetical protein SDRG_15788 [Saprolegnia diclina VS20]
MAATGRVNKHGEPVVKAGVLFKKGSGGGLLKRKNWKPRYFELTQNALRYFTFQDGEVKGEIMLKTCGEDVLEIMPADSMKTGGSASTIWRIAINAPSRRLLIAAGTEHEMNDWVDALLAVFHANTTGTDVFQQARGSLAAKELDFASMPHIKKSMASPSRSSGSSGSSMFVRPSQTYYVEQEVTRAPPSYVEEEISRPMPKASSTPPSSPPTSMYVPTPEPILYAPTHPEHIVHHEAPPTPIITPVITPVTTAAPPAPIITPVTTAAPPTPVTTEARKSEKGPNFDPSGEYAF